MSNIIRWGVLSTAKIGVAKVIPAMQKGRHSQITAIASRDINRAKEEAKKLDIPKAYGSYESLLAHPDIDAIYNPLPNHLHIPWTKKCLEAGKHVLCEKPMALNIAEIKDLISFHQQYAHLKVGEAFMVKTHPQWLLVRSLARSGELGKLTTIQAFFSYYKLDPDNIRNIPEYGGGGLYDIGVYPMMLSRFVLGEEPISVLATLERDPEMKIDRLASVIMEFPTVQASFICSTQTVPYQTFNVFGTDKRLEVPLPYNAPNDRPTKVFLYKGDLYQQDREVREIPVCDQYTLQGDEFSRAILEDRPVPVPLTDTLYHTAVIEAIFAAAQSGTKQRVKDFL